MKKLSIVIPCYNEEATISKTLPLIFTALQQIHFETELILIDDGSQDETSEKAQELLSKSGLQYIVHQHKKNKGKGAAVKTGVSLSTGEYVLFFDIDLSTSLDALHTLVQLLEEKDYPIIIGSRLLPDSKIIKTQNLFRVIAGNLYRKLGVWMLGLKVSDIGCGFKCFRKDIADKLFSKMTIERWSFDAEILYLAQKEGIAIKEIPVVWQNNPDSRLKILSGGINSLYHIISLYYKKCLS